MLKSVLVSWLPGLDLSVSLTLSFSVCATLHIQLSLSPRSIYRSRFQEDTEAKEDGEDFDALTARLRSFHTSSGARTQQVGRVSVCVCMWWVGCWCWWVSLVPSREGVESQLCSFLLEYCIRAVGPCT